MLENQHKSIKDWVTRRFKSRVGLFMVGSYLIICLLTVFALLFSAPDAMSILAPLALTTPWSFLLLEIVPENLATAGGPVAFGLIFIVSVAINATIIYFLGWLLTMIVATLKKE